MTGKNDQRADQDTVRKDGVFVPPQVEHIRVVLFDLDGTLRHTHPSSNQVVWDFAASHEIGKDQSIRHKTARWVHSYWAQSPELLDDIEAYPNEDEFWMNYLRRHLLSLGCAFERVQEIAVKTQAHMRDQYVPQTWVAPETPLALQALKDAGFRLGLLSNRTHPCHEELQRLGLDIYFELILTAGEVSAWKPDARIFLAALERLGAQPSEALYVGDNYYADIVGAEAAGLLPVLVDPEAIFPEAQCPVVPDMVGLLDLLLPERRTAH